MKLIVVLSFVVCYYVVSLAAAELGMVGRNDTSSKHYPFVAAILYSRELSGNGAIIAPSWILTSASAVYPTPDYLYDTAVGTDDFFSIATWTPVQVIYRHPEWVGWDYNIALVYLNGEIKYAPNIQPINIGTSILNYVEVEMVSFGRNEDGASHLRVANYTLTSDDNCVNSLTNSSSRDVIWQKHGFCIVPPAGTVQGQWQNDAGAPLVANGDLYGLFAFSENEGGGSDGATATSVAIFTDWVQNTIAKYGCSGSRLGRFDS